MNGYLKKIASMSLAGCIVASVVCGHEDEPHVPYEFHGPVGHQPFVVYASTGVSGEHRFSSTDWRLL